jgi:hypothetical protein
VYDSARGSVRQCGSVWQCVAVCSSAAVCVSVTVSSSAGGSVRQSNIVFGSASGSVWQCEGQCAAVWSERQCMTVRAAAFAAVRGSAAVYVIIIIIINMLMPAYQ